MPLGFVQFHSHLIVLALIGGVTTGAEERVAPATAADGVGKDKLLLFTVATDADHDGLRRLRQSAEHYGLRLHVLGADAKWLGFGTKLKVIHRELTAHYVAQQGGGATVLLFVDAYDVLVDGGEAEILRRFNEHFHGARIVFGAEQETGLDSTLREKFPKSDTSQKLLNSGLYIGYAEDLLRAWDEFVPAMSDTDDDQLFYAYLFIDEKIRVENIETHTNPVIIHGQAKLPYLNVFANYLAGRYNLRTGCGRCQISEMKGEADEELPMVGVALLLTSRPQDNGIDGERQMVVELLDLVANLDYPDEKLALLVVNKVEQLKDELALRLETLRRSRNFASFRHKAMYDRAIDGSPGGTSPRKERIERLFAVKWASKLSVDSLFLLDDEARITNPRTLRRLVLTAKRYQLGVLAPLLPFRREGTQPKNSPSANFWLDASIPIPSINYHHTADYNSIVTGERRNYWAAACIHSALLVARSKFGAAEKAFTSSPGRDLDGTFCSYCASKGHIIMYADNQEDYGHIVPGKSDASVADSLWADKDNEKKNEELERMKVEL